MTDKKITLGQAIDQIIAALESLDKNSRETALSAVCSHMQITLAPSGTQESNQNTSKATNDTTHQDKENKDKTRTEKNKTHQVDIRSFKEEKKPNSARQMACIVGYYLQELAPEEEKKESISKTDLEKYFKQANYPLPETIQQVLPDSKKSGYFDSAGRGTYKLNAVGYNLVAHNLPSDKNND